MTHPALGIYSVARSQFFNIILQYREYRLLEEVVNFRVGAGNTKMSLSILWGQGGRKSSLEDKDMKEEYGSQTGRRRGTLQPKQGSLRQHDK